MIKGINKMFAVFFIIGIFCMPYFSLADTQIEVQEGEIDVEIIPNNPEPYDEITINLSSYATDLNKALISWQGSTGVVLSGVGKISYSFTAQGPNNPINFNVKITPFGSMSSVNKKISINPSEVETVWESVDTYTPPFYKGKSLPTKGSTIRVLAIPNTNTIKSGIGNISYSWKNGDDVVQDASGYNKNSYTFKNSLFDTVNNIQVMASSVDGYYSAVKNLNISIYNPSLIFYRRSPTEGILYNKSLDENTVFPGDEMTIVAEPYFLKMGFGNINYDWRINGKQIDTPSKKTELTIRPTDRGGFASINMTITNLSELFQNVSSLLKLTL